MAVAHRVYAKALFDAAKEQGRLNEVRSEFADFVEAVEASPELRSLLRNPQIDARAKRDALDAVLRRRRPAGPQLPAPRRREGPPRRDRRDPARVRAADRGGGARARARADDRDRALRRRGRRDRPDDRAGLRPPGRGHPLRRPRPDRRHRHPGRLAAPDASVRGRLDALRQELAADRKELETT